MSAPESGGACEPVNQVLLRGRLADVADERRLPSGDILVAFRITVARPPQARSTVRVDSIDCTAVPVRVRTSLARLATGDDIEVEGRLERRFWRGAAGPTSRYAVNARAVRRVRSGRRAGA